MFKFMERILAVIGAIAIGFIIYVLIFGKITITNNNQEIFTNKEKVNAVH